MAEPEAEEPAKTVPRSRVTVLAVILFLILLATGGFFLLPEQLAKVAPLASTGPLEAEIAARRSELDALTWERPVLRGAPLTGDGEAARRTALAALDERRRSLGLVHDPIEKIVPADPAAELPLIAGELEEVRQSLQYESVGTPWRRDLDRPRIFGPTDALLIAAATEADSAGECLELLADRIRFDQDDAVGGSVPPILKTVPVVPLVLACAARASDVELATASWEMHELAMHRVPIARDLRRESIERAGTALAPTRNRARGLLERLRDGGSQERAIAEAWTWLRHDATFRDADDLGFPAIEPVAVGVYPEKSIRDPHGVYLAAHASFEAQIKQLALALSWLEGAWQPPVLPEDEVSKDPFSGERLIVDRDADGGIRIVSVGPDGRRDPKPYGDDLAIVVQPRARPSVSGGPDRHGAP